MRDYAPLFNWLLRRSDISSGAKLCYARIVQYCNVNAIAWPSILTLAKETGSSKRQTIRYIKELEKNKLLKIERSAGRRNSFLPVTDMSPVPDVSPVPNMAATSDGYVTGVVPNMSRGIEYISKRQGIKKGKVDKFQKPSIEEIEAYCTERRNGIDAEQFFDFYEAKGWKIGKEPMRDWKAAVRTWEKNREPVPPETRNDSGFDEIAARKAASDKAYAEACAR